jgi:hypothetical protein
MIASPRLQARIAGFLYLVVVLTSTFSLFAGSGLIVRGDAAATATGIMAQEPLFRLAFAANLIAGAAYVAVIGLLYGVLKPVSRSFSLVAAFLGLTGCAVGAATSLSFLAPVVLLGGAPYLSVFSAEQLQALAMISLRLNAIGSNIGLVFFGFYCLSLAGLVLGSTFIPRLFGVLLAVAGMAWLTGSLSVFLSPPLANALSPYAMPIAAFGEGAFTLWLLVMGVNATRWKAQAEGAA